MKKVIKIFCWIILILFVIAFFCIRFIEYQLVKKMPDIIQNISSPEVTVSVGSVKRSGCLFRICVNVENLSIQPIEHKAIEFENLYFEIPPLWPIRVNVKTLGKNEKWIIDASLGRYVWDVRSFYGRFENLKFDLSGKVDGQKETGQLVLKTTGLKDFLREFTDLPPWFALLIQNTSQKFILKPQDGSLRFYGIPVLDFHILK